MLAKLGIVIEEEMGVVFGVVYGGLTHRTIHFVECYTLYIVGGRFRRKLLALPPLDERSQEADAPIELFRNVLAVYNKTGDRIHFLVADNCSINRCIATKVGVP